MISPDDTIVTVAPYFKPYVELIRVTGEDYYFRKASTSLLNANGNKRIWHPRIEHRMLAHPHSVTEGETSEAGVRPPPQRNDSAST